MVNTEAPNEEINESATSNDLEKVEEALNEVPTNLEITEEILDNKPVSDELSEVNQIQKEFEDLKNELDNNIGKAETPEQKEDLIKQEIKKAESLKARAKKIIKSVDNPGFTNSWNGISYDL